MPLDRLKVWLKGDCGYGANPVNCWLDQSTNANSAFHLYGDFNLNPGSNREPVWASNAVNGHRAIWFQGTNAFHLPAFSTNIWTEAEAFLVLKSAGQTNVPLGLWHISNGANGSGYPNTDGHIIENFGLSGFIDSSFPPVSITNSHLYSVASVSNHWFNSFNNSVQTSTTNDMFHFDTSMRLGWGANSAYFQGYIAELMIFNRSLTDAERGAVGTNYLKTRYGLSW